MLGVSVNAVALNVQLSTLSVVGSAGLNSSLISDMRGRLKYIPSSQCRLSIAGTVSQIAVDRSTH